MTPWEPVYLKSKEPRMHWTSPWWLRALSAEQGTYILGDVHTYSKLAHVKEDALLEGSDIFLTLRDIQEIGE